MSSFYYPRPTLVTEMVNTLAGSNLFGDATNGLFLAAPRRTGKSTFLQNELQPALERHGKVVVYVDLWSDKNRNPGDLIAAGIGRELGKHLGIVARAAKATGLDQVTIAGTLRIDTSKIGKVDGLTLTEALRALIEASGKPVALIIDEAQHALTSEEGESAMTALKSARDQLNRPGAVQLLLIMSGSDRDKLLRLVNSNAAPFFGSNISRMPELGEDFVQHIASLIGCAYPPLAPVDSPVLWQAFQMFGRRPQPFVNALGTILNPLNMPRAGFEADVANLAAQKREQDEHAMASSYCALRPLEQAVLWRMLKQHDRFRPYDADAMAFYREKTGDRVTPQKAQNAIESLRSLSPALIWKSAKGEYALDDTTMYKWFHGLLAQGRWPPVAPAGFVFDDE
ncbi:MAG: ATP-binding protein [Massilia sp.]|nr:ATP-binding protein [Massilia sp.]